MAAITTHLIKGALVVGSHAGQWLRNGTDCFLCDFGTFGLLYGQPVEWQNWHLAIYPLYISYGKVRGCQRSGCSVLQDADKDAPVPGLDVSPCHLES